MSSALTGGNLTGAEEQAQSWLSADTLAPAYKVESVDAKPQDEYSSLGTFIDSKGTPTEVQNIPLVAGRWLFFIGLRFGGEPENAPPDFALEARLSDDTVLVAAERIRAPAAKSRHECMVSGVVKLGADDTLRAFVTTSAPYFVDVRLVVQKVKE